MSGELPLKTATKQPFFSSQSYPPLEFKIISYIVNRNPGFQTCTFAGFSFKWFTAILFELVLSFQQNVLNFLSAASIEMSLHEVVVI